MTGLVLAVILSFVGELLLDYHDLAVDGDSNSGGDGVDVEDDEHPKNIVSSQSRLSICPGEPYTYPYQYI